MAENIFAKRCKWFIVGIWILSMSVGFFQLIHVEIREVSYETVTSSEMEWISAEKSALPPVYSDCEENWSSPVLSRIYAMWIFLMSYCFPGLTMRTIYRKIGRKLEYNEHLTNSRDAPLVSKRNIERHNRHKRLIKTHKWTVILFHVCWTPIQVRISVMLAKCERFNINYPLSKGLG